MRSQRPRSHPARPFLIVFLVLSFLAAVSYLGPRLSSALVAEQQHGLQPRATTFLAHKDDDDDDDEPPEIECRHVHAVKHQCAFVKENCDDEAGIFDYLELYYCTIPNAKPVAFIVIAIWAGFLFTTIGVAASDFFCINLSTISTLLGMSENLAGVTFLAFGNGSPDVFSTFAAIKSNSGSLAVGELIGAAGFITAVVAGSMGIVRPFKVARRSFVRDILFFIVAVAFSMYFLANGKLDIWECVVMVAFYIFYVAVVVSWHWYLTRKRKNREREAAARSHYTIGDNDSASEGRYHDYDDTDGLRPSRTSHTISNDDFNNLERADLDGSSVNDELDEETDRAKMMGEMSSNMRVRRPTIGDRRTVYNPIRPSLMGALEFQAVVSALHRSRNIQPPMNLRSLSDDTYQYSARNNAGASLPRSTGSSPARTPRSFSHNRFHNRAASAGAVDLLSVSDQSALNELELPESAENDLEPFPNVVENVSDFNTSTRSTAPLVTLSPPALEPHARSSPSRSRIGSKNLLALPTGEFPGFQSHSTPQASTPTTLKVALPGSGQSSRRSSVTRSPILRFRDEIGAFTMSPSTLSLPPPRRSSLDHLLATGSGISEEPRPFRWWPYRYFPAPEVVVTTLFPSMIDFRKKTHWARLLSIAVAPSFFLLTMTLPVVEPEADEEPESMIPLPKDTGKSASSSTRGRSDPSTTVASDIGEATNHKSSGHNDSSSEVSIDGPPMEEHTHVAVTAAREWNRWLVCLHCFTAPWFIVWTIWMNLGDGGYSELGWMSLYTLIGSVVLFLIVTFTTTSTHPPKWHLVFCILGFAVSIAWISTIADEVVSVLKTIGVIFNMSDAILGLTIFAVGNSLSDLVADVTVARLGYPVMALSACFGGPMLNILLGIGLSGLYIVLHRADVKHHKHPEKHFHPKPFHVDISMTLLISAVALLVTLVGLLIVVPLNGWKFDRKIGIGLITLWVITTVGNVVVEVTGRGGTFE